MIALWCVLTILIGMFLACCIVLISSMRKLRALNREIKQDCEKIKQLNHERELCEERIKNLENTKMVLDMLTLLDARVCTQTEKILKVMEESGL